MHFSKLANCSDESTINTVGSALEEPKCCTCKEGLTLARSMYLDKLNELFLYEAPSAVMNLEKKLVCVNCLPKGFVLNRSFFSQITDTIVLRLSRSPDPEWDDCNCLCILDTNDSSAIKQVFAGYGFDVKRDDSSATTPPFSADNFYIKDRNSLMKLHRRCIMYEIRKKLIQHGKSPLHAEAIELSPEVEGLLINTVRKRMAMLSYDRLYKYSRVEFILPSKLLKGKHLVTDFILPFELLENSFMFETLPNRPNSEIVSFIRDLLFSTANYSMKKKLLADILTNHLSYRDLAFDDSEIYELHNAYMRIGCFSCNDNPFGDSKIYKLLCYIIKARNFEMNSQPSRDIHRYNYDSELACPSPNTSERSQKDIPEPIEDPNIDSIFDSAFTWLKLIKFEISSSEITKLLDLFLDAREFSPVYFADLFVILTSKQQIDDADLIRIKNMVLGRIDEEWIYKACQSKNGKIMKSPITREEEIDSIRKRIIDILDFDYKQIPFEDEDKKDGPEDEEFVSEDREIASEDKENASESEENASEDKENVSESGETSYEEAGWTSSDDEGYIPKVKKNISEDEEDATKDEKNASEDKKNELEDKENTPDDEKGALKDKKNVLENTSKDKKLVHREPPFGKYTGPEGDNYKIDFNEEITCVRSSHTSFFLYYINCIQKLGTYKNDSTKKLAFSSMTSGLNFRSVLGLRLMFPGLSGDSLFYDIDLGSDSDNVEAYLVNFNYTELAAEFFKFVAKDPSLDFDRLIKILSNTTAKGWKLFCKTIGTGIGLELSLAKFFKMLPREFIDKLDVKKRFTFLKLLMNYEFFYIGIVVLGDYFEHPSQNQYIPGFGNILKEIIPEIIDAGYSYNLPEYYETLFILKSSRDKRILSIYYEKFACILEKCTVPNHMDGTLPDPNEDRITMFLVNELGSDLFNRYIKKEQVVDLFKAIMRNPSVHKARFYLRLFIENVTERKLVEAMQELIDSSMPLETEPPSSWINALCEKKRGFIVGTISRIKKNFIKG